MNNQNPLTTVRGSRLSFLLVMIPTDDCWQTSHSKRLRRSWYSSSCRAKQCYWFQHHFSCCKGTLVPEGGGKLTGWHETFPIFVCIQKLNRRWAPVGSSRISALETARASLRWECTKNTQLGLESSKKFSCKNMLQ